MTGETPCIDKRVDSDAAETFADLLGLDRSTRSGTSLLSLIKFFELTP